MLYDSIDDVVFDCLEKEKEATKKARKSDLFSELEFINNSVDNSVSPSSLFNTQKEEKKKEKEEKKKEEDVIDDEWLATLTNFKAPKTKKKSKYGMEDFVMGKKKGKKKKEKDDKKKTISHKKEFDTEMSLLKDLYKDQSMFVDSLQKRYDQLDAMKSSARGVGKFTTDLIMSINSARTNQSSILSNIISLKKTIADLDFKERKEFGSNGNGETTNLNNYASSFLKNIVSSGRNTIGATPEGYDSFDDMDDNDDLSIAISNALGDTEREEEVEKYLKYENQHIKVKVLWNTGYNGNDLDQQYDFVAMDMQNNIIPDYPLPMKTTMTPNFSTRVATDKYGEKYELITNDEM
jgi:hypothetical protein